MTQKIHVIGASGRSGLAVSRALAARGASVVPVVRNPARWRPITGSEAPRIADLTDPRALAEAIGDAQAVISCAHARHIGAILTATQARRLAFLGSTRRFTRWPDSHGDGVIAGEAALRSSGRAGVLLHPTMIYGAAGEDNVRRLAALLRRLPVVPLPGGGRALVQPVYQDDVTQALCAVIERDWSGPQSFVIAGPEAMPYRDFVAAVARAAGLRRPRFVGVPAAALIAASPLTLLPGLPRIRGAEIRRLLEDKAFDIAPARAAFGFAPISLAQGLASTFRPDAP